MGSSTARYIWRDVLVPLAAFAGVFLFPAGWFLAGFLVVGQAHFAMAFLYQYRGGKINTQYLLILALCAVAAVGYFLLGGTFYPIFLTAATLFAAHFALDEVFLHKEQNTLHTYFTALSFSFLFCALILHSSFPGFLLLAVFAGILFSSFVVTRFLFSKTAPSRSERYIFLVGALLFVLPFATSIRPEILLSLVILLHCFNWYVDYGRKLADRGDARAERHYWLETLATLTASTVLYFMYVRFNVPFLAFAFLPMYYDAWALVHFAVSMRLPRIV